MVAVECGTEECQYCYVLRPNRSFSWLRPNRSFSWRQNLVVFAWLCAATLAVAVPLVAMGFWPILLFAGLELLAVGIGLYRAICRCHECEVICVAASFASRQIVFGSSGAAAVPSIVGFWGGLGRKLC